MHRHEELEQRAYDAGLRIDHVRFNSQRIKGLYCDGSIAINDELTSAEINCVLAEEMGHHYTSSGNILDLQDVANLKQEHQARMWGYNDRIGLIGLIDAFEAGCRSRYEMAEYLEITEDYLAAALEAYHRKYGMYVRLDNHVIFFEPNFGIM